MTAADASTRPLTWVVVQGWLEGSKYYWLVTSRAHGGRPLSCKSGVLFA
jgi:hypothetical protein